MAMSFIQHVIHENLRLFEMIHRFNCEPGSHVHSDHFEGLLPKSTLEYLQCSLRGKQRFSQWVIQNWDLKPDGVWEFEHPRCRLALLEPDRFLELLRYSGTAINAHAIAKIIDRRAQTEIRESLGEDLYHFALKRAPMLVGGVPADLLQSDTSVPIETRVNEAGEQCFNICLHGAASEIQSRLKLKLPEGFALSPVENVSDETCERVWNLVKRILLTEIAPELKQCFN